MIALPSLSLADTSGKDKLILLFIRSSRNRHTTTHKSQKSFVARSQPNGLPKGHGTLYLSDEKGKRLPFPKGMQSPKTRPVMLIVNSHAFPLFPVFILFSSATDPENCLVERNEFFESAQMCLKKSFFCESRVPVCGDIQTE